jgi:hypothetical protein
MIKRKEKYIVYSDLHIGGQLEINPFNFNREKRTKKLQFSKNTVFLGDNFDLENALHRRVHEITELRKDIAEKIFKAGGIFIDGNHELFPMRDESFAVRKNILFLHGDIIAWGSKKAQKWRLKKRKGKGELYWGLLKMFRGVFPGERNNLKNREIDRAVKIAKSFSCSTIVIGHFHVKNLTIILKESVRIIVVPRGICKLVL